MPIKALRSPTTVLIGEPVEEFDLRRGPTLPDQLPGPASDRTVEGGKISGPGRVAAAGCPLPGERVRLCGEGDAGHQQPDLEILPNLLDRKSVV